MDSQASRLDIGKLRKLQALARGGKTEGERQAARRRAEKLAAKAGMPLQQALSKLDGPHTQARPASFFEGWDDWMEDRDPGWKARKAARKADQEEKRLSRCRNLLDAFGSEDAVFAEAPEETKLRVTPDQVPLPQTVQEAWAEYQRWEEQIEMRCAFFPHPLGVRHLRISEERSLCCVVVMALH